MISLPQVRIGVSAKIREEILSLYTIDECHCFGSSNWLNRTKLAKEKGVFLKKPPAK